jgi:hypothetical protein
VKGLANGPEGADVRALVWVGSFSTEPTVGTMTSRFNIHNLTSRAADGMSLAIRETLIARTVTQMNPNPEVGWSLERAATQRLQCQTCKSSCKRSAQTPRSVIY